MEVEKKVTKCNACNIYPASVGSKCESCNGVIKHNIENLRTMYKEKTCKCKYSQPATKCSENGISSYCTKCGKGY
jgi:hypothetical protein